MTSRAYIPKQQPALRKRTTGRPITTATSEFNTVLLETLNDPEAQWARVRTTVDRAEILALRDTLRIAAKRMTENQPELLGSPEDQLKVDLLVTDEGGQEVARGGVRGRTNWLDKIPEEGRYVLWFRMHLPLDRGERVRQRKEELPGGHLLLRTDGGRPHTGEAAVSAFRGGPAYGRDIDARRWRASAGRDRRRAAPAPRGHRLGPRRVRRLTACLTANGRPFLASRSHLQPYLIRYTCTSGHMQPCPARRSRCPAGSKFESWRGSLTSGNAGDERI